MYVLLKKHVCKTGYKKGDKMNKNSEKVDRRIEKTLQLCVK